MADGQKGSSTAQVVIALITTLGAVGVAWITARSRTDARLEQRSDRVAGIGEQSSMLAERLDGLDELRDRLASQSAELEEQFDVLTQQVESLLARTDELAGMQAPQKICSAFVPGNWRDSILVPSSWTPEDCRRFKEQVQADVWQLACILRGEISWGGENGGMPGDNGCGWS